MLTFVPKLTMTPKLYAKKMNLSMRFSWILMLMLVAGHAQAQDRLYADEFPLGDVTLLD